MQSLNKAVLKFIYLKKNNLIRPVNNVYLNLILPFYL